MPESKPISHLLIRLVAISFCFHSVSYAAPLRTSYQLETTNSPFVISGGIMGIILPFDISGNFSLITDEEAGTARFAHSSVDVTLDASAYDQVGNWDRIFGDDGQDVWNLFVSSEGELQQDGSILFGSKEPQQPTQDSNGDGPATLATFNAGVNWLEIRFSGDDAILTGGFAFVPGAADFFTFDLEPIRALAVPEPQRLAFGMVLLVFMSLARNAAFDRSASFGTFSLSNRLFSRHQGT